MGSLAQISSGAIRWSFNTRFRTRFQRVLVQIPREVPEGSGADTSWGSGGFRCRYLLRLQRVLCGSGGFRWVPVQIPCEVPGGCGADTSWGSGGFRCRYLVKFRRKYLLRLRRVLCGSGGFRWVPAQIPCEVPGVSCAATRWGSGGLRC